MRQCRACECRVDGALTQTEISRGLLCVLQEDLRTFVSLGPRAWTEARETLTAVLTDAVDKCIAEGESDLIREACWEMVRAAFHQIIQDQPGRGGGIATTQIHDILKG